jgi:hypothetical protein
MLLCIRTVAPCGWRSPAMPRLAFRPPLANYMRRAEFVGPHIDAVYCRFGRDVSCSHCFNKHSKKRIEVEELEVWLKTVTMIQMDQ